MTLSPMTPFKSVTISSNKLEKTSDEILIPKNQNEAMNEYQCEDPNKNKNENENENKNENETFSGNSKYRLHNKFNRGSHGEVWKAKKIKKNDFTNDYKTKKEQEEDSENYILKRMFVENGEDTLLSGLREIHFGELLKNQYHITRYVEHFYREYIIQDKESDHTNTNIKRELWLVFKDEGKSMRNYLYSTTSITGSILYQSSPFWRRLRMDQNGAAVMKETMRQLLESIGVIHERNITHRDIKPSNILINQEKVPSIVKLGDFGSAVDEYTIKNLYGNIGPSQREETREYQPPEVIFNIFKSNDKNGDLPYDRMNPKSYDIWSIGIVFLELILGSPDVFSIDSRTKNKLDRHLIGQSEAEKEKTYILHAMTEYCIYSPLHIHDNDQMSITVSSFGNYCHLGQFNTTLMKRDPLKKGFQDPWGLHLLWKLLQWDPSKRITAKQALRHAYFVGPYTCGQTKRKFGTLEELRLHKSYLNAKKRHSVMAKENFNNNFIRKIEDIIVLNSFKCPACHRNFSNLESCNIHIEHRKHNKKIPSYCLYDIKKSKNTIDQSNRRLSMDSNKIGDRFIYGYSDLNGKRLYMEDIHKIQKMKNYELYALMDGHLGTGAAEFIKISISHLLSKNLNYYYRKNNHKFFGFPLNTSFFLPDESMDAMYMNKYLNTYKKIISKAIKYTFREINEIFLNENQYKNDFSGSTLTILLLFPTIHLIVSANIGDSSAILGLNYKINDTTPCNRILLLTEDHLPNNTNERIRIESSGGFIEFIGVWRVMGQLAISRSIGDRSLGQYLSSQPYIQYISMTDYISFIIVATDGFWETMSYMDAYRYTLEKIYLYETDKHFEGKNKYKLGIMRKEIMENIARDLTYEAYLRGSLDNIAVLLIDLRKTS